MGKKLSVALIGYGFLGKWHAEKANQLASLDCVVEPNQEVWDKIQGLYPNALLVNHCDEIPQEIKTWVIATPTSFHEEIIRKGLERDCHLFCEKPMVNDYETSLELREKIKKSSGLFQVGHSERFHSAWDYLKDQRANLLEESNFLEIERVSPYKGRASDTSVVDDLMIHDLDLLSSLFKDEIEVQKVWESKVFSSHADHVVAWLKIGPLNCSLKASRVAFNTQRAWTFQGSQGLTQIDLLNFQVLEVNQSGENKQQLEKRDHLFLEQKAFYQAILEGTPVPVDIEDACQAVALCHSIKKELKG